jgi:hypothetical protein
MYNFFLNTSYACVREGFLRSLDLIFPAIPGLQLLWSASHIALIMHIRLWLGWLFSVLRTSGCISAHNSELR